MDLRSCTKVIFRWDCTDATFDALDLLDSQAEIAFGSKERNLAPVVPGITVEAVRVSQHVETKEVQLSAWIRSTQMSTQILDSLKPIFLTIVPSPNNLSVTHDNLKRVQMYADD